MHLRLTVGAAVLFPLAACAEPPRQRPESSDMQMFDGIITRELIRTHFQSGIPLSFAVASNTNTRVYTGDYTFARKDPTDHYTCSISVARAGLLLDPDEYAKQRADSERDFAEHFPDIGLRAQGDFWGAGPGGAAFGLTFRTSDGKFDVRITVSNQLPTDVQEPQFDVHGTAREISLRYDMKAR